MRLPVLQATVTPNVLSFNRTTQRGYPKYRYPDLKMTILCPNGHENPDSNRFCQVCGGKISQPVSNNLAVGVLLGDRYQITAEIGQGGFGRTYLCEHISRFNERCVLKEFAPQVQGTAFLLKAQQLFEREAGVMYQLEHPQIPKFREMFRVHHGDVSRLFLVQDYVEGDNYQQILKQRLKQGRTFTEAEVTQFLNQILPVLSYIHSKGVIHRDISPDNLIRRSSDGLPMLIDFGGVKQVAVNAATECIPASQNSDIPTRLGKVGYAPNEQMQRGVVSPHSDLYALAATTMVLLTGREPADLIDPLNFTWNWRTHISLSSGLGNILDRMLSLRPNDRFSTAQDVLTAIKAASSVSGTIEPIPTYYPPTQAPGSTIPAEIPTVIPVTKSLQSLLPTVVTLKPAKFSRVFNKTSMLIVVTIAAIGLGWIIASKLAKRPTPRPTPAVSLSESNIPEPITSERISSPTELNTESLLKPIIPAGLLAKGVNPQAYRGAIKQIFIAQNPQGSDQKNSDSQIKLDSISRELGGKLSQRLGNDAVGKIGRYNSVDRSRWRSNLNKLHISDLALIDLTNAKYKTITEFSARKLGLGFDQFLNTPMGQVYQATMVDRVRAIQAKKAMGEIIFPVDGTKGTVKGTLQPGGGIVYISSLFSKQNIEINISGSKEIKLSIYPPVSNLQPILAPTQTNHWAGKTTVNGYHEFVLVANSDRPIEYKLTLSAANLSVSNLIK